MLIAAALFLWGIGEGMFYNFMPIRLESDFSLSKQQIGWTLGAFGFFMAIMHLPTGYLSDRFGRKPLLVVAWLAGLFAALTMGLAKNLVVYLIGFFAYGMTAFVSSPLNSYVTAARDSINLGRALSAISAIFSFGMILGPVSGGWIAERYGMNVCYLAASVLFAFSNVCIFLIAPQPLNARESSAPPTLWKNARFVNFLVVYAFAFFALYLAQPLTPNFLEGTRRLTLTEIGWIFSAGAFGNSMMMLGLSRFHPRRGFIVAQFAVFLFAALIWRGVGLPIFMLGYFLLGGFRAAKPLAMAQVRALTDGSQMGLSYGAMETVGALATIVVPPIAGFVFDRAPFVIYPLAMGLIALSIAVSHFFTPHPTDETLTAV